MRPFMLIWLLGTAFCPAAAAVNQTLPLVQLLEDVDVLQRIYEQAHPGLYRYNTKAQMAAHFADLRFKFSRDRTLADAYVAISQFLATIKCGHSYANFYNQPESVVHSLFMGKNRVPFLFRWIGGRIVVTRDLTSEGSLKPGSEILAIDGHRVDEILSRLMTIARADGGNDAKRVAYLEVRGADRYEAFDIFLPLFYPSIGERITLSVRMPRAKETTSLNVTAQDVAQRVALAKECRGRRRAARNPGVSSRSRMALRTSACRVGHFTTASGTGRVSSIVAWTS